MKKRLSYKYIAVPQLTHDRLKKIKEIDKVSMSQTIKKLVDKLYHTYVRSSEDEAIN